MALHTIDLPCIADTWIDLQNPNTSHGTETTIKIATDGTIPKYNVAGLKFNHSQLPSRKKITRVLLRVYNVNAVNGLYLHQAIAKGSWNESSTWNTAVQSLYSEMGFLTVTENSSCAAGYYIEADLSTDIPYSNEAINYGIALALAVDINFVIQSREGANPPMLRVTYEDVPPDAPTPKTPVGIYKDSRSAIRFDWNYNSSVGGIQKKFDLQWSADQLNWTTVSQTTANNYCDISANTLPAGNIYWKVRCYNEYSEVGNYCSVQSFYAIGAPVAPTITSIQSNSARPVVSWSAFNQQIYQLQVLSGTTIVYDSGNLPSISIRQHKVMAWLLDGVYTVKLRVKNEYGLWSAWGQAAVTITTVKPAKPIFTVAKTQYGTQAKAIVNGANYALLYRDGKCIAKQTTKSIVDDNGQVVENLIGMKGDCENLADFYSSDSDIALDSSTKVFGTNSLKITAKVASGYHSASVSKNGANISITELGLSIGDYVSFSGYLKTNIGTARLYILFFDSSNTQLSSIYTSKITSATFTRVVKRGIIPASTAKIRFQVTLSDASGNLVFAGSGENTNADGLMVQKITAADYALSDSNFLAQYPFGNGEAFIIDDNAVANGCQYEYKARAVTEGDADAFTDSDPVSITADFKGALIAPVSDPSNVFAFTRSLNTPPKRVHDSSPGGAFVQYAGRRNPVWEPNEHITANLSCGAFYLKTQADVDAFDAIYYLNGTVLYRDTKGRKIYGVLTNRQVVEERQGYTVSFAVNQVDYNEEVEV